MGVFRDTVLDSDTSGCAPCENNRKKGSGITAGDFREALSSFGLPDDKSSADRLFKRYDWRQRGNVSFQAR